jgi:hypothetical protein
MTSQLIHLIMPMGDQTLKLLQYQPFNQQLKK